MREDPSPAHSNVEARTVQYHPGMLALKLHLYQPYVASGGQPREGHIRTAGRIR